LESGFYIDKNGRVATPVFADPVQLILMISEVRGNPKKV